MYDGYVISGAIGPLQMLTKDQVQKFIGPYRPTNPMLDAKNPVTVGPFDGLHGWYFEHKAAQQRAMDRSFAVIEEVSKEYAALTGRKYEYLSPYRMDDAEVALVVIGSTCGTARTVVDDLREQGVKAGMVKVHLFRPFPVAAFVETLKNVKVVGVMDRADSSGAQGGPLFLEVRSALYDLKKRPQVVPIIYGLGGRDIFPDNIREAYDLLREAAAGKTLPVTRTYLNLRKDRV
jgi:pyruvate ferredoxin oxidoreductase alpha subunit